MVQSVDPSRRRALFLLAVGAAVVATGCRTTSSAGSSSAGSSAAAAAASGAAPRPVPALPPVPVARPGRSRVVFEGPANGGRLALTVDEAGTGVELGPLAFEEPPHAGYREVTADEARRLWSPR